MPKNFVCMYCIISSVVCAHKVASHIVYQLIMSDFAIIVHVCTYNYYSKFEQLNNMPSICPLAIIVSRVRM